MKVTSWKCLFFLFPFDIWDIDIIVFWGFVLDWLTKRWLLLLSWLFSVLRKLASPWMCAGSTQGLLSFVDAAIG
jgi:hypothetical protein